MEGLKSSQELSGSSTHYPINFSRISTLPFEVYCIQIFIVTPTNLDFNESKATLCKKHKLKLKECLSRETSNRYNKCVSVKCFVI